MHNTKFEQEAEAFFNSTINDILNHEEIEDEEQSLSEKLLQFGVNKSITYSIVLAGGGPSGVLNLTFAEPGTEEIQAAEICYADWFKRPICKPLGGEILEVLEAHLGFLNIS